MFDVINSGNLHAIQALGRSDITLILDIIKKSLYLVILVLFIFLSPTPEIFVFVNIIISLIAIAVNSFPNRKLLNYKYRLQILDLLPNFIIAFIMGAAVYLMNLIKINSILLLAFQIVSGMILYLLLSILTRNKNFIYLVNEIKKKRRKHETVA